MIRRTRRDSRSLFGWTLAFSALATIAACGAEAPEWGSDEAANGAVNRAPDFMPGQLRSSKRMSDELRAAYIRSTQQDAPDTFSAERVAVDGFYVKNGTQLFDGAFDRKGLVISPRQGSWSFSLRTTEIGCAGEMVSLAEPAIDAESNRVRYSRLHMEEWYMNGPLGIEQGFVFDQPLACEGIKTIRMQTGGALQPTLDDNDGDGLGDSIRFGLSDVTSNIDISHLYVADAQGKRLPAWMTVESDGMAIHFDDTDAMYPVEVDPLISLLEAKILNANGLGPNAGEDPVNDEFGYGLSLFGDRALIGAPKSDEGGRLNAGSAYVFRRQSPGVWVQEGKKLVPSDSKAWQWFGFSVALSENRAVLSSPYDGNPLPPPNNPPSDQQGSAYVFAFNGTDWVQEQKIKPMDNRAGDVFGVSAAISGDFIIVGAHGCDKTAGLGNEGAAYIFKRAGTTWVQEAKLFASDAQPEDLFGTTVTIAWPFAGIAAVYDDDLGNFSGSMYPFRWDGAAWVEEPKILAQGGAAGDIFGYWAAMSGNTMVVTAALYDHGGKADAGAAFVYVRDASGWNLQQRLTASDAAAGDWFGSHVAIDKDSILVGSQQSDVPGKAQLGAAYWYMRDAGVWTERYKLLPVPGAADDRFGWTVGISGKLGAIGAPFDDTRGSNAGAVYIFRECSAQASVCTDNAECCSGSCVDGFCCDTACGGNNENDCQACAASRGASANGTCTVIAANTTCRTAAGTCDAEEKCDGKNVECPVDRKRPTGAQCRDSVDPACDVAERCDGTSNDCPADGFAPAGTVCRGATGTCDIPETCTGTSPACPADVKVPSGQVCRTRAGACDVEEACDGANGACPPDGKVAANVTCREAGGICDSPEVCDGKANDCPEDRKFPTTKECRASGGLCDSAENCDGMANDCPVDTKLPVNTLCRASNGVCDTPEKCDGTTNLCPKDDKSPMGTLCRSAAGICDLPETCDGLSDACPVDVVASPVTVCRSSAGLCDQAELCNGKTVDCPLDEKLPSTQVCRLPKGLCDEIEFCDGMNNACPDDVKTAEGVFCRAPKGLCDEPEACDGKNDACPKDQLTENSVLCRPAEGLCDLDEACTGLSAECPADQLKPAGFECRETQGTCDAIEACDGINPKCPEDKKVEAGVLCRKQLSECDAQEICDGLDVNCPQDGNAPDGTVCSIGVCETGVCIEPEPTRLEDLALFGGGPLCQTGPIGSSSARWPFALLAVALGTLRRRSRSAKH